MGVYQEKRISVMKPYNQTQVTKLIESYAHCITVAQNCQPGSPESEDWFNLSDGIGDIICTYEGGLAQLEQNVEYQLFKNTKGSYNVTLA